MAERRSQAALVAVAVIVVLFVVFRIASGSRQHGRGGVPPRRTPVLRVAAGPPDSLRRPGDSLAPTPVDSSSDATSAPVHDSVEMNVPQGYYDLLERAQTRRQLRASARITYLNEVVAESSDSALHRWDNRGGRDPVRVYLASDTVENYQPAFLDAVRSALNRWDEVGLPVRFTYVGDSTRAEVVFGWRRQFDIDRTGQTDLTWDRDGHVLTALVTIATFDPGNHAMGVEDVRVVALHEIGHLLGLNHSSDSTDIMFGHTMARDLSPRDEATARLLYDLPPGSVR